MCVCRFSERIFNPPPLPLNMVRIGKWFLSEKSSNMICTFWKNVRDFLILNEFKRPGRKLGNLGNFFSEIFKSEFSILAVGQNRKLGKKKIQNNFSEISDFSKFSNCHSFIFFLIFFLFFFFFFYFTFVITILQFIL